MISNSLKVLDDNSDIYGNPHVTGFMDAYGLKRLANVNNEQLEEYIRAHDLQAKEATA